MDKKLQEQVFIRPQVEKGKPVFVKDGRMLIAVRPEEIICLKADDKYCHIYVKGGKKPIVVTRSFTSLLATPVGEYIVQVHRGVGVNLNYIESIYGANLTLCNGLIVGISCNRVKEFAGMIRMV